MNAIFSVFFPHTVFHHALPRDSVLGEHCFVLLFIAPMLDDLTIRATARPKMMTTAVMLGPFLPLFLLVFFCSFSFSLARLGLISWFEVLGFELARFVVDDDLKFSTDRPTAVVLQVRGLDSNFKRIGGKRINLGDL